MALFEPVHHRALLATARELISRDQPEVAIVVAQMACEVHAEQIFVELFRYKDLTELSAAVDDLVPSYNLANDKVRKLFAALSGDQIQHQPFWPDYKISVGLRNKAVHAGGRVTKEQGRVACRAAEALVAYLDSVVNKRLRRKGTYSPVTNIVE